MTDLFKWLGLVLVVVGVFIWAFLRGTLPSEPRWTKPLTSTGPAPASDEEFKFHENKNDVSKEKSSISILTGAAKTEVMHAVQVVMKARSTGVETASFDDALQDLAKHGDAVFLTIGEELALGNKSLDPDILDQRLSMIDFLGDAARSNDAAKQVLWDFSTAAMPVNSDQRQWHIDLADRVEAFSLLVRVDESAAIQFVKTLQNENLRREYVYNFYIGYTMKGLSHDEALSRVYELFGSAS